MKPTKKRWKPSYSYGEVFYYVAANGLIERVKFSYGLFIDRFGLFLDSSFFKFGNCFKTKKQALAARAKIRKALRS